MAITFVQGASNFSSGAVTSLGEAYTSSVTSGNLLVVCAGWLSSTATATVTDTLGNTWHSAVGPSTDASIPQSLQIWYTTTASSGANTVTVHLSTSLGFTRMAIHEYSGVDTLDQTAFASGSSGTPSSGSVTTTQAAELIFGWCVSNAGISTAGTGFTQREVPGSEMTEDMIVSSTGSYAATFNASGNQEAITQVATFYKSSGGTTITGTVACSIGAASLTAAGKRTTFGSVSAPISAVTLSATSKRTAIGSVSAPIAAVSLSATGKRTTFGTVSAPIGAVSLSATSKRTTFGTVSAPISPVSLTATGQRTTFGSSSLSSAAPSLTALGTNIVLRGSPQYTNSGGTVGATLTFTKPTGVVAGDLIMIWAAWHSAGTVSTAPTGFTALTTLTSATNGTQAFFYRIASGGEASTFTLTISATSGMAGVCVAYSGVSGSTPFDNLPTSSGAIATSTTIAPEAVTTTINRDRLVWFGWTGNTAGGAPGTITVPTGYLVEGSQSNSSTAGVNAGVALADLPIQATAGSVTANGSQPASKITGAMLAALIPSGASGTTITGTVSCSIGAVSLTATSKHTGIGTVSAPIGAVSLTAVGQINAGSVNLAIGPVTLTATGQRTTFGSVACSISPVTLTATSKRTAKGVVGAPVGAVSLTATSKRTTHGSAVLSISPVSLTATGTVVTVVFGSVSIVIGAVTLTASTRAKLIIDFSTGVPASRWTTGDAVTRWSIGPAGSRWTTGAAE